MCDFRIIQKLSEIRLGYKSEFCKLSFFRFSKNYFFEKRTKSFLRPNGCQSNRVSESSNWSVNIPNILSLAKWFVYRKRFQSCTSHKCLKNGRFSDGNILILRNRRSIEWDSRAKYERECGASKKRCVTKVKLYPDNFEITRRAGITDTGFCMIHYLHGHLPVYFHFPVQSANPFISHFHLAQF